MSGTNVFYDNESGSYCARRWWDNGQGVVNIQSDDVLSFIKDLKEKRTSFSDDYVFENGDPGLSSSELGNGLSPKNLSSLDASDYDKVVSALSGF
jgi:hypothetical protein